MPQLSTRRIWVGFYSEMTGTVAMLFDKHPVKCPVLKSYNVNDEAYIGSIWVDEWALWFGTVQPFVDAGLIEDRGRRVGWVSTELTMDCQRVICVDISMPWSEHGLPIGLNVCADN